jgi:integrase
MVKEVFGEDSKQYRYLKVGFSMGFTEKKDRDNSAQEKVIEKNENQIEVSEEQIKLFKDQLLSLMKVKFKIVPAIILAQIASGSRLIEILSDEFKFSEGKENYIKQNNVAKNRDTEEREVEKPILFMTPENFIKLMSFIRSKMTNKEGDDNVILSNRYGKRVNAKVKKIAKEVGMPGINSSHDLRRIYGVYSYKKFASSNMSFQVWLSKVLGHSDLNSAANYSTINLI